MFALTIVGLLYVMGVAWFFEACRTAPELDWHQ